MEYRFIADLLADTPIPKEGILSRVLQKGEHVNITLFGFFSGQELSTHSAPTPAVLCFLSGEADVKLGEDHPSGQGGVLCLHAADVASRHLGQNGDHDAARASEDSQADKAVKRRRVNLLPSAPTGMRSLAVRVRASSLIVLR